MKSHKEEQRLETLDDSTSGNTNSSPNGDVFLRARIAETGGKEVYAPASEPFERPAEKIEQGPLFVDAEEIMPPLAPSTGAQLGLPQTPMEELKEGVDRRDFMRMFSSTAFLGASAAACVRRPEEVARPYVDQAVDHYPGKANYYASTCGECPAGCRVMVKTREGRPVKLEGDPLDAISQGALCSVGQSTLQELFHPERRKQSYIRRNNRLDEAQWMEVYERLAARLKDKRRIAIVAKASTGNDREFYKEFLDHIGSSAEHFYTFEPNSLYAQISKAHELAFGKRILPRPDLRGARLIVGIGSDFLETGISPVFMSKSFAAGHAFNGAQSSRGEFVQFESFLSLTGAKADTRYVIPPGSELAIAVTLLKHMRQGYEKSATPTLLKQADDLLAQNPWLPDAYATLGLQPEDFDALCAKMFQADSLVLAGSTATLEEQGTLLQLATILINQWIGAYGKTLFLDNAWFTSPVEPGDMKKFVQQSSQYDAVFFLNVNPAFALPASFGFKEAVAKIETVVSVQSFPNETDELANFVLAGHHYLESWGDAQPAAGYWNLRQPTVRPLTDSRQAEDILLWLAAHLERPMGYKDYRSYLDKHWQRLHAVFGQGTEYGLFIKAVLRRGGIGRPETQAPATLQTVAGFIKSAAPAAGSFKLLIPFHPHLKAGQGATRPILQENPHPLSTIVWDSYILIAPQKAMELGIKRNDLVRLSTSQGSMEVAVYPMPGTHPDTLVFYRGNGRALGVSKVSDGYGLDPLGLVPIAEDALTAEVAIGNIGVNLEKTGRTYRLATTQKQSDIGNRTDIVRSVDLQKALSERTTIKNLDDVPNLYPELKGGEHRWGMSIDLDKCTGCGACNVACSTENNVPQIGREQVIKGREMFWIRIDRYFSGTVENPTTFFQPMPCQHCNHAPCEAVCPVFATTHDPEGINAMTYNRCVGTRYCANACPYKVRRFNWWTHKWNKIGDREMDRNPRALNPDVTVRTRGIMEKCNFCYQRIRDAKHRAKYGNSGAKNVFVQTACQQTCPSDAITFGDLLAKNSEAAKARSDYRGYLALGGNPDLKEYGLKTLPNVSYQMKVVLNGAGPQPARGPASGGGHSPNDGHDHG